MRLDVIFRVGAKIFISFMFVFGLYVQFHGDFGPGGGFQAGVVVAATIIFYAIIFGLDAAQKVFPPRIIELMVPAGVGLFAGVGVVGMLMGENYLNYSPLAHDPAHGQEYGILLIELGVLTTVSGTMVAIFYSFIGRGR